MIAVSVTASIVSGHHFCILTDIADRQIVHPMRVSNCYGFYVLSNMLFSRLDWPCQNTLSLQVFLMGADFQKLGIYHHDEFLEAAAAAKRGPEAPEPAQEQVAAAEEPVQVASAAEEVAEAAWLRCRFFRNCSEHAYLSPSPVCERTGYFSFYASRDFFPYFREGFPQTPCLPSIACCHVLALFCLSAVAHCSACS